MGTVCLLLLALVFLCGLLQQPCKVSKANPTAPWKEETRFIASSSDLYSRLCNSSRLDLCHSCRAGTIPLFFFPVSWIVLFYWPFPRHWPYLPLNLVSVSAWPSPTE